MMFNVAKNFDILSISFSIVDNCFDRIKLFLDLDLVKVFLGTLAQPCANAMM